MRTSQAAPTAASASGHSRSAQQLSTASRCRRTTSANTAVRSRSVWACLNRRTRAASACPASLAVIAATPIHGQLDLTASRMPRLAYLYVRVLWGLLCTLDREKLRSFRWAGRLPGAPAPVSSRGAESPLMPADETISIMETTDTAAAQARRDA
jgi:uncharacterized MAPEG superfamily protein